MGVSDLSRYDTLLNGIMTQQAQLQQLSLEQTTGTTLNQPSDDPAGTSELLGINLDLSQISTFQKNAALVQTNMNTEDSVETSLGQLLQSAQTIAQGVGTEPVGSTARNQAISELGNTLQQIVSLANTQVGDDYIFGGTNSGTPPMQSTGGTTSAVLGTSLTTGTVATASSTATAATGVYQLTTDGAGDVTLTNTSDPSETQTVTGVTNGTPSINFGTLGVTVTAGSNFTVAGLNGQTIAVGSGYTYGGNTTRPQVTVGVGDTIQTNHTGDQVFGNSIAALQATIAAVQGGRRTTCRTLRTSCRRRRRRCSRSRAMGASPCSR